jgi:hypothetical protein
MNPEVRTRYVLTFGKFPGNDWYSDSREQLQKDFEKWKDRLLVHAFEVKETVDTTGAVLKREDKPIYLQ